MRAALCPFLFGPSSSANWEAWEMLQTFLGVCGEERESEIEITPKMSSVLIQV